MIRIKQAVIVEGKYDKIKLETVVDTLIITTDGFGIFKNKEKTELIRTLAKTRGVVIMTDSDSAGFLIRSRLKDAICKGEVYNAYIPDILGKEHRKVSPSKEGKLGVEGVDNEIILTALKKAGVTAEKANNSREKVKKSDLYDDGFCGKENSTEMRNRLKKHFNLPEHLNQTALLEIINTLYTPAEYRAAVEHITATSKTDI